MMRGRVEGDNGGQVEEKVEVCVENERAGGMGDRERLGIRVRGK